MNPIDVARYTDQADDWLSFACGYSKGRLVTDPVVEAVTEGRCSVPSYSSCGDLPNYMLFRLGCRAPAINRKESGHPWRVGKNFDIYWSPKPARNPIHGETYQCGDCLCIWKTGNDAHALVVIEHTPGDRVLLTAEYGQKWQGEQKLGQAIHPDARLCVHQYSERDGVIWIGSRAVQRVLPLVAMIEHCASLNQLVAAEDPPQLQADGAARFPDGRLAS